MLRFQSWVFLLLILFFASCGMQESGDEKAIRERAKAYEEAFNARKADALASMWVEDADYVNPIMGEEVSGRDAIQKMFAEKFKETDLPQMEIKVDSITFPKEDEALETGTTLLTKNGKPAIQLAYKVLYEKVNGQWLISEVREVEEIEPPSHYEHLKELEWLVGSWVDEDEDSTIMIDFKWDRYKNFLVQHFTVAVEGKFQLEGKQIIGWDASQKKIRSWIFDSDGGFGEGKWTKKDKSWNVETIQTLEDGSKASSTNIFTPINGNSYKWESVDRETDGELLPNIEPVTIIKKEMAQ